MKKILITLASTAALTLSSSAAVIGWEAENFDSQTDFSTGSNTGALGGTYITTDDNGTEDPPNDTVTYTINAPTGGSGFNLYIRFFAPSASDDSMYAPDAIGASPSSWTNLNSFAKVEEGAWTWYNATANAGTGGKDLTANAPSYTLAAGSNTIVFGGRESGFLIDAFVLSTDSTLSDTELTDAVAVPEPSMLGLVLISGAFVFLRRRLR